MVWVAVIVGVILLIIFPKEKFSILGVLVLVAAVATWIIMELVEKNQRERQRELDRVQVSVKYDKEACSEEFPLLVVIRNTGNKTVNKVSWNIAAWRPEYSSNVIHYGRFSSAPDSPYSTDKILNKDEVNRICQKVPSIKGNLDPAALNYQLRRIEIVFRR